MPSHRCAIAAILLGLDALVAGILLGSRLSRAAVSVLHRGGDIPAFFALLGGVACGLCPGRIHFTAFKCAVVLYLNAATIFAAAFSLIWELNTGAFASLPASSVTETLRSPS